MNTHEILWCKDTGNAILSNYFSAVLGTTISFRSFDLAADLSVVHDWVNRDYTRTFWQMRGSIGLFRSCYQCILQNPFAHSFIGLVEDKPVCQFDIYKVSADELAGHVDYEEQDCGFHLCMSPLEKPLHGLTGELIRAFLMYYFSQTATGSMFAEPDAENIKSIQLLEKAGFHRVKTVEMSYKTAYVYQLTKTSFLCKE